MIANNGASAIADLGVQFTDSSGGTVVVPASKDSPYQIVWIRFTVAVPTGPTSPHATGAATPATQQQTVDTLLTVPRHRRAQPAQHQHRRNGEPDRNRREHDAGLL